MAKHDYSNISLSYGSAAPGRIRVEDRTGKTHGDILLLDLTVHQAAELSERLGQVVRRQGYDFVARKRPVR